MDIKISLYSLAEWLIRVDNFPFASDHDAGHGDAAFLLAALRAAADPSRLRLLALCARDGLTVGELVDIVGQSQPRVSRHLKVLVDAGLLERLREGSRVFHRLARRGEGATIGRGLLALLPEGDGLLTLDRTRLETIMARRAAAANAYFQRNASRWGDLRALHVADSAVEDAIAELLDIGTGTGRMLEVLGPRVAHAQGIDLSTEMLAVARDHLARGRLANCDVRQADMYQLPYADGSFDAVTVHQVLHFADRPARVIAEAARVLRPGGRLLVADLAPHAMEYLRDEHEHRRLGFDDGEVAGWFETAGLTAGPVRHFTGKPLVVAIWTADRPPGELSQTGRARPPATPLPFQQHAIG